MDNHNFWRENSLFLWPLSIAMLNYWSIGYQLEYLYVKSSGPVNYPITRGYLFILTCRSGFRRSLLMLSFRKLRQKEWWKSYNPCDLRRCNTFWTGKLTFSQRRPDVNPQKRWKSKDTRDVFYQVGRVLRGGPWIDYLFCYLRIVVAVDWIWFYDY